MPNANHSHAADERRAAMVNAAIGEPFDQSDDERRAAVAAAASAITATETTRRVAWVVEYRGRDTGWTFETQRAARGYVESGVNVGNAREDYAVRTQAIVTTTTKTTGPVIR